MLVVRYKCTDVGTPLQPEQADFGMLAIGKCAFTLSLDAIKTIGTAYIVHIWCADRD